MDFNEAIAKRSLVAFTYDGYARVVIPATHGRHATTGNSVLRAYQIRGVSKTRPVPSWGLFREDRIVSAHLEGETFTENPPGYKRGDVQISPIECQL